MAGLHPDLQLEVIKSKTADLHEAADIASEYETAKQSKHKEALAAINELNAIDDPEERAEIEALRQTFCERRMFNANNGSAFQNWTSSGSGQSYGNNQNQGNNYSSGNGGASNSTLSGAQSKRNNPAFGKTCHYCKKKNHFQIDCHKRKRENGAMVKVKEIEGHEDPALESIFKSSKN